MTYSDSGSPLDPSEVIGSTGFIAEASPKGLAWHPGPTLQSLPDYLIQYSRDIDAFSVIDPKLAGSSGPVINNQTTTGLLEGDICFLSSANTWSKASANSTLTASTAVGVFNGTAGSVSLIGSVIDNLKCTTAGGTPAVGSRLYLASSAADSGTAAGKATSIPPEPSSGGSVNLQIVGVCVDNTNYAPFKTVKVIFQPSYPTILVG
jgi:hypothetical protein